MMRDVADPSEGVLTDVRVLDLSTVLAAPVTATFLTTSARRRGE
jgi:crotonobetainyl-CoA:carnitine CoA-transferase CaiB-like acyl-CoA transferase